MRVSRSKVVFLLLAVVMIPRLAEGQGVDKGWYCPADKKSGSCNGKADCDAAWQRHLNEDHGGGSGGPGASGYTQPPSLAQAFVMSVTLTTAVSTGIASFENFNINGENQWREGVKFGLATGPVLFSVANSRNVPAPLGLALSAGGGAVAGQVAADRGVKLGTIAEEDKKKYVAAGAGAGFVTWAASWAIGAASPKIAHRWLGPSGKINFVVSGRWIRVVARW